MLTEKSFDTGEIVMNFAEGEPTGKPLVLLHAATQSWQIWKWQTRHEFLPTLAKGWQVYLPDLRGHGQSGRTTSGYGYEDFLPDVTAFIERQVGEPVVLVGFSLSASIALGVGARRPDLVRAVILLEPALASFRDADLNSFVDMREMFTWLSETQTSACSVEDVMARCREIFPDNVEGETVDTAQAVYNLDPQFIDSALNNQLFKDYRPELFLPRLACPALLVYGEARLGSVINDGDLELFRRNVPHGIAVHIYEAGHNVVGGETGRVTLKHVTQFLSSL